MATDLEKKLGRSSSSSIPPSLASLSSSSSRSLTSSNDDFPKEKEVKRVSFKNIEVVELPMILGDHPACRDGLPVQPGWKSSDRYSVSIDIFEETRSPRRRTGSELYLSSFDRLKLIRNIPLSPASCPPRVQESRSKLWKEDNILEKVAPPPMAFDDDEEEDTEDDNSSRSTSSRSRTLDSEDDNSSRSNSGRSIRSFDPDTELARVEERLDLANSRFDELTSRLDDLDLIRKERIEKRRRRGRKPLRTRGAVHSC